MIVYHLHHHPHFQVLTKCAEQMDDLTQPAEGAAISYLVLSERDFEYEFAGKLRAATDASREHIKALLTMGLKEGVEPYKALDARICEEEARLEEMANILTKHEETTLAALQKEVQAGARGGEDGNAWWHALGQIDTLEELLQSQTVTQFKPQTMKVKMNQLSDATGRYTKRLETLGVKPSISLIKATTLISDSITTTECEARMVLELKKQQSKIQLCRKLALQDAKLQQLTSKDSQVHTLLRQRLVLSRTGK